MSKLTINTKDIIETIISKGHQDRTYRQIYKQNNLKLKIEIKSDSYRRQCYAHAYALDGLEWKLIYSIPYSEMKTPEGLYYQNNLNEALFFADRDQLRQKLNEILF